MERLIYLDNACTSFPKAPGIDEAAARFLREHAFNPGRGGYRGALETGRIIERLREHLARLIASPTPNRVILTSGSTHAINLSMLGLFEDRENAPRSRVVVTSITHNAITRPLARQESLGRIEIVMVHCDTQGRIDPEKIIDAIDERTALVCMTHASNVCGTIQPIGDVGRAIRDQSLPTLLLVDGAQTAGVVDIDVQRDAVDLLAFSGHKGLRGPTGIGALYVSERAFDQSGDPDTQPLRPILSGGTGGNATEEVMPTSLPKRFEPGTPNTLGGATLLAAVETITPDSRTRSLEHERALIARLRERLAGVSGLRLIGADAVTDATPVQSLVIDGQEPTDVAAILDESFGIAVRAGLHCAPKAHATLGTLDLGGTVRVSPGPTTTEDDIDVCADALREIAAS